MSAGRRQPPRPRSGRGFTVGRAKPALRPAPAGTGLPPKGDRGILLSGIAGRENSGRLPPPQTLKNARLLQLGAKQRGQQVRHHHGKYRVDAACQHLGGGGDDRRLPRAAA